MKTQTLEQKVISKLEKWGNNTNDVKQMVSKHFEQASSLYYSVNNIAMFIRTVY